MCCQVLHRDIKTANVLLSKGYGKAKICDVGLAHIMGTTGATSTPGHHVQATFAYCSPEMLFNQRWALYTVGCCICLKGLCLLLPRDALQVEVGTQRLDCCTRHIRLLCKLPVPTGSQDAHPTKVCIARSVASAMKDPHASHLVC